METRRLSGPRGLVAPLFSIARVRFSQNQGNTCIIGLVMGKPKYLSIVKVFKPNPDLIDSLPV